jgi:hypothetical protein
MKFKMLVDEGGYSPLPPHTSLRWAMMTLLLDVSCRGNNSGWGETPMSVSIVIEYF